MSPTKAGQMPSPQYSYRPDYTVPPGALIKEYIDALDISASELARRCGRSPKLITEIILGKAPLEPDTALQFERVLRLDASVWVNLEAAYRLYLARLDDDKQLIQHLSWIEDFPLQDLASRGFLKKPKDAADKVRQFIQFFGAGSVEACQDRFCQMTAVAYRHSPSFKSSKEALLTWLRLGEIRAEEIECKAYDRAVFMQSLTRIRSLTTRSIEEFLPELTHLCSEAGIAFVIVRPVGRIALSGISRWLSPRRALIQQTMRHLSNDHFWFTFFHEAAHLLLHSRKSVFVDGKGFGNASAKEEEEANEWAAHFLIPTQALTHFIRNSAFTERSVCEFAEEQGVHPGIVVGQLQHQEAIGYHQLNNLRDRFEWAD
jgi:HTH-type transcriptional regulator/antitoxin HigA